MHPQRGAYVYVDRRGDATLLMYRVLSSKYLVVVFRRGRVWQALASFTDILNEVPICRLALPISRMPLHETIAQTAEAWVDEAFAEMARIEAIGS